MALSAIPQPISSTSPSKIPCSTNLIIAGCTLSVCQCPSPIPDIQLKSSFGDASSLLDSFDIFNKSDERIKKYLIVIIQGQNRQNITPCLFSREIGREKITGNFVILLLYIFFIRHKITT
jgi:hypothetical protein